MDILQAIGGTSMVRLRKVVPEGSAAILAKLEWENPTGSMKDKYLNTDVYRAPSAARSPRGAPAA